MAATFARTYRAYVNPDGSLDLNRAVMRGRKIVSESLVTALAAGWVDADVGTAVADDLTAVPIAEANSDTDLGTGI